MAKTYLIGEALTGRLRKIAVEECRPIEYVIEDALDQYQKQKFWAGVSGDYARLKADPAEWLRYQDEITLLEGASLDGLDQEPPYYTLKEERAIRAEHTGILEGVRPGL